MDYVTSQIFGYMYAMQLQNGGAHVLSILRMSVESVNFRVGFKYTDVH